MCRIARKPKYWEEKKSFHSQFIFVFKGKFSGKLMRLKIWQVSAYSLRWRKKCIERKIDRGGERVMHSVFGLY